MNGHRKSDERIIPKKPANKGAARPAEPVEERRSAEGNSERETKHRARNRVRLQQALDRVHRAARQDKELQFTTLWHHVYDVDRLEAAYLSLKRHAAPGVDGQTWEAYDENREANLADLSARLRRGAYRARPVQRVYIPKADGRQRPIGIPVLEDKIVQRSTVEVLNAVYEADFLGFSYGFRPGRSQHNALDALAVGTSTKKVNWVLDADICGFFDAIDHEWLLKFIQHRITDKRVERHIKKWLNAGVLEDDEWKAQERGTPQGGSISPVLANVYLHYAFDLWAQQWRNRHSRGDMVIVRYADDFVVGFQHRADAERFRRELEERLRKFGLELHPEKTRTLEFGRFAADNRRGRGEGKPETFDFLGFTHICGKTRKGRFILRRQTMRKRLRAKCAQIKVELRKRLHRSLGEVGEWLRAVLKGHYNYYAVPLNYRALQAFYYRVQRLWHQSIKRRSQRHNWTWERMKVLSRRWLPPPRITHPHPWERLRV